MKIRRFGALFAVITLLQLKVALRVALGCVGEIAQPRMMFLFVFNWLMRLRWFLVDFIACGVI